MKRFYNSLSIKRKVNIANIIISLIVLILLSVISFSISKMYLIKNVVKGNYQNLKLVGEKFDIVFDSIENATEIAVTNPRIQNSFGDKDIKDEFSNYQTFLTINTILKDIIEPWTVVRKLVIYDRLGNVYESDKITPNHTTYNAEKVFDMKGMTTWVFGVGDDRTNNNEIRFRRLFNNYNTGATLGVVDAIVREEEIYNIYSNVRMGETGYIFIVDSEGRVISHKDKTFIHKNIKEIDDYSIMASHVNDNNDSIITMGQANYIVTNYKYEKFQWTIYSIVPLAEVTGDVQEISKRILLTGVLCIGLSVILSGIVSKSITKPIKELTTTVTSLGNGDIEARAEVISNDEVGILSKEFNRMANEVSELMTRITMEQKSKRKLEMAMLQAQINPHFLYNTIDNICGLALMNRNEDIVFIMKALSKFYRGVLSGGTNIISIGREIETANNYMKIMKMRYGTKFDYAISIDEELYAYSIVKMTLQPILENAIYHGIRNKLSNGFIDICAVRKHNGIELIIKDDGVGMHRELADSILRRKEDDMGGQSFGLKSTDDRLKLYFGSNYGLTIESEAGIGTTLIVSLPLRKYEVVKHD